MRVQLFCVRYGLLSRRLCLYLLARKGLVTAYGAQTTRI